MTLYFSKSNEMDSVARKLYARIIHTRYADLQRKNFMHLPGDVPVFHPDGDPIELGIEDYHHFHILFSERPGDDEIAYIKQELKRAKVDFENVPITYLEY